MTTHNFKRGDIVVNINDIGAVKTRRTVFGVHEMEKGSDRLQLLHPSTQRTELLLVDVFKPASPMPNDWVRLSNPNPTAPDQFERVKSIVSSPDGATHLFALDSMRLYIGNPDDLLPVDIAVACDRLPVDDPITLTDIKAAAEKAQKLSDALITDDKFGQNERIIATGRIRAEQIKPGELLMNGNNRLLQFIRTHFPGSISIDKPGDMVDWIIEQFKTHPLYVKPKPEFKRGDRVRCIAIESPFNVGRIVNINDNKFEVMILDAQNRAAFMDFKADGLESYEE